MSAVSVREVSGAGVAVSGTGVTGQAFRICTSLNLIEQDAIARHNTVILKGMVTDAGREAEVKRQAEMSRSFARIGLVFMVVFFGLFALLAVNASLHGHIFNTSGLASWLAPLIAGGIPSLFLGYIFGVSALGHARDLHKKVSKATPNSLNDQIVRSIFRPHYYDSSPCGGAQIQEQVLKIVNSHREVSYRRVPGEYITFNRLMIQGDLLVLLGTIREHLGVKQGSDHEQEIYRLIKGIYEQHCRTPTPS